MPKTLVNIDWLSFSLLLYLNDEEKTNGANLHAPLGYQLREFKGTNQYKRRHILYTYDGEKVLTLLTQPHSRIINSNSMFVEIANKYLYDDIDKTLRLLPLIHPASWQSLSRLDVCGDFNPTDRQEYIIEGLDRGDIYVTGKRDGGQFHDIERNAGKPQRVERKPRQIGWGSKHSDIKWKLYNKTLEITEASPYGTKWYTKPYIVQDWKANGIDPNHVWRLECSIMSAGKYEHAGQRLDHSITHPDQFTALFWDMVKTRFQPRKNQGHAYKRYDELIPLLDPPTTDSERLRRRDPISTAQRTAYTPTLRALVRELGRDEIRINPQLYEPILSTIDTLLKTCRLGSYFTHCTGKDWDYWRTAYCDGEYVPF